MKYSQFIQMCKANVPHTTEDGLYNITPTFSVQVIYNGEELFFRYRNGRGKLFNVFLYRKEGSYTEGKVFRTYH